MTKLFCLSNTIRIFHNVLIDIDGSITVSRGNFYFRIFVDLILVRWNNPETAALRFLHLYLNVAFFAYFVGYYIFTVKMRIRLHYTFLSAWCYYFLSFIRQTLLSHCQVTGISKVILVRMCMILMKRRVWVILCFSLSEHRRVRARSYNTNTVPHPPWRRKPKMTHYITFFLPDFRKTLCNSFSFRTL